jgi:MFS family permease
MTTFLSFRMSEGSQTVAAEVTLNATRRRISFNPWVSLAAGFLMQFLVGTPYLFGAFAGDLRSLFGISQAEVQLLGTLLNIGMWLGVTGGLVLDRLGRLWAVVLGATLLFVGYFGVYLAASGLALGPSPRYYPLWCILFFLAGQGIAFLNSVALKVNIMNFTLEQRGQIVGVLQCAFALSGGIFSILRSAFFGSDVASLLLVLSIVCSVGAFLMGLVVNATSGAGASMVPRFFGAEELVGKLFLARIRLWYAFAIGCACYVFVVSVLKPWMDHDALIVLASIAIVIVCSVVLMPIGTGPWIISRTAPRPGAVEEVDSGEDTPLEKEVVDDTSPLVPREGPREPAAPPVHVGGSVFKAVFSLDFLLLFILYFAGAGTSIATVNNMASLVQSKSFGVSSSNSTLLLPLVYPETSLPNRNFATTFVALFSSLNTLGRLALGYVSDKFQHRVQRTFWIMLLLSVLIVCQAINTIAPVVALFPLVILIGFAYGGLFAVVPATVADFYGPEKFGVLYGVMTMAPAAGSLLLATVTYGSLSDRFSASSYISVLGSDGDITRQCVGSECFVYSVVIFISVLVLAWGCSFILWWKNRGK